MNMSTANLLILVAGDSRIRGLDHHLRTALDDIRAFSIRIEYITIPGAGITELVKAIQVKHTAEKYDQLYLLAGVCDLMQKRSAKNLVPSFDTVESMAMFMCESFTHAQSELLKLSPRPVLCELVGLDIRTYNINGRPHGYYQQMINEGIPQINRHITGLNAGIETMPRSPFIAGYVHKKRKGRMTHRYDLALSDGLHYTVYFKQRVAQGLARMIDQNYQA